MKRNKKQSKTTRQGSKTSEKSRNYLKYDRVQDGMRLVLMDIGLGLRLLSTSGSPGPELHGSPSIISASPDLSLLFRITCGLRRLAAVLWQYSETCWLGKRPTARTVNVQGMQPCAPQKHSWTTVCSPFRIFIQHLENMFSKINI